jgi:hypothetical protein
MELRFSLARMAFMPRLFVAALTCGVLGTTTFAGTVGASFTVSVRVMPSATQGMLRAEVKARREDGSTTTLTAEQKVQLVQERAKLLTTLKPDADGYVRLVVEM